MGQAKKRRRPAVVADKSTPDHQHPSPAFRTNYFLAFLLIIAIAMLYGHSLWNPLVFDDKPFFVDSNLRQYGSSMFHLDLRWFSYASFGWTYNLFGLNWFWYRLGNMVLHAITSILLFVFFSRLLDATAQPQDIAAQPHWPAFLAALVFALHPAAVYGVAYLVQRSIIMATLFGIASLLCYLEGLTRDRAKWFVFSALFYFLAVFSKEHSIMIPGVAAALTLMLYKPSFDLAKRVWLPFALYLVIGTLIILRTKGIFGAAYEPYAAEIFAEMSDHKEIHIENSYPLSIITQGYLFFKYLLLWGIPNTTWMSIDIRQSFPVHFLAWPELPGFILFLAYPVLSIKLLLKGGRTGLLGLGFLFPWLLYFTEFTSIRIQEQFVLYRSYLWMSGLPIILLGCMSTTPKKFVTIMLAIFCLMLAILAWNRLDTFSDNLKLWADAIDKYRGDNLLNTERGYYNRGNAYSALGRFSEAIADYEKAIEIDPKYASAYFNCGNMYLKLNNLEKALDRYNTAIELKINRVKVYENRGVVFAKIGRLNEALSDFDQAVRLDPGNAFFYSNRAIIYSNLGQHREAQSDYSKALSLYDDMLRVNDKNHQAWLYRGLALNGLNRKAEAMESFRKSCAAGNQGACKQLDSK